MLKFESLENRRMFACLGEFSIQAEHDEYVVSGETQLDVLANDTDESSKKLRIDAVGDAYHGTVEIAKNGKTVTYTPDEGFVGVDRFVYIARNQHGCGASAYVSIDVVEFVPTATEVDDALADIDFVPMPEADVSHGHDMRLRSRHWR